MDGSGCSTADEDGDGVLNDFDACRGTPASAIASVGADGCPADADGDSISDGGEDQPVGACGAGALPGFTLSMLLMSGLRRRFRGRD